MSDFLVHFAKPSAKTTGARTAYDVMISILGSRHLQARSTFGFAREKAPDPDSQKAVCFSETPLHLLQRISQKRSGYGIVFRKDFILEKGGNPIWYAYKDQPVTSAFGDLVDAAEGDPFHPIWKVTPFVDRPGIYGQKAYFYEHEREWRVVGGLRFKTSDVAFLVIPEHLHDAARDFFNDAERENIGPNYKCPYIDAKWSLEDIAPLIETSTGS